MYNANVGSALKSSPKNQCYVKQAAFDKKDMIHHNLPGEDEEVEKLRHFDSYEDNNNTTEDNIKDIINKLKEIAAKTQKAADESKVAAEDAEKADKKTWFINGKEISAEKVKAIKEAYDYFRKAATSNDYTTVCRSERGYSYSIRSGKKSVIMIDPEFMASIRDNPEALKKYADEIESMKRLDKQFEQQAKQQGKTVVSRDWRIEKDGSISSWSVTKTEHKATKGFLQRMNEMRDSILKKKMKKKKEEADLQEKRSRRKEEQLRLAGMKKAAANEKIKRKIKKVRIYDLTRLTPKKYPGSGKRYSVSISCGSSPSLITGSKDSK